jgi:hypothetical protein
LESDEFNHVVDALYDAAVEPDLWLAAIAALCRYMGASATHFVIWDKQKNTFPLSVLGGEVHEQAEPLYVAHYGALDPRMKLREKISPGEPLVCHHHFDEPYVAKSELSRRAQVSQGGLCHETV